MKPVPESLWPFYRSRLSQAGRLFAEAVVKAEAAVAVAAFVVLLVNRQLAQKLMQWDGINPLWALVPIVLFAIDLLMRASHSDLVEASNEVTALERDVSTIRLQLDAERTSPARRLAKARRLMEEAADKARRMKDPNSADNFLKEIIDRFVEFREFREQTGRMLRDALGTPTENAFLASFVPPDVNPFNLGEYFTAWDGGFDAMAEFLDAKRDAIKEGDVLDTFSA